jgi:hypothetical protein
MSTRKNHRLSKFAQIAGRLFTVATLHFDQTQEPTHRGLALRLFVDGDGLRAAQLGDLDGDGAEELIVLEDQGDAQTLAVWRWQGWSFSLVWRSDNGRYRDLALLPGSDEQLLITASP